jgi:hypothetical protein
VRRTILTLAAVLAATAANAQSTVVWSPRSIDSGVVVDVVVDPEEGVPGYKRKFMPPADYVPPDQRLLVTLSAPIVPPTLVKPPEPVVINFGKGGSIMEHQTRFWTLKQQGASVEMRGPCYSACTLITLYIPKQRLCIAEGSFLAFHSAQGGDLKPKLEATLAMYSIYPAEIRQWIDRNGGPHKMTVETYWVLYPPDLWAMGYPRCK